MRSINLRGVINRKRSINLRVFYFNEPITGTFKAVLIKDGQKLLEKRIRLEGKVIAECDFSAGLEGLSTFGEGTYSIQLETDGSTVAVSSDMRVE